jgi:hypothetical protein
MRRKAIGHLGAAAQPSTKECCAGYFLCTTQFTIALTLNTQATLPKSLRKRKLTEIVLGKFSVVVVVVVTRRKPRQVEPGKENICIPLMWKGPSQEMNSVSLLFRFP